MKSVLTVKVISVILLAACGLILLIGIILPIAIAQQEEASPTKVKKEAKAQATQPIPELIFLGASPNFGD